jgi:hypothetical protein
LYSGRATLLKNKEGDTMRNIFIFSLILILAVGFISPAFCQETITITTYYPAPVGSYQTLQLYPTAAGATPNCTLAANEGTMYYDNTTNQLAICRETAPGVYGVSSTSGFWLQNTAFVPSVIHTQDNTWRVGIGTNVPAGASRLTLESGNVSVPLAFRETPLTSPGFVGPTITPTIDGGGLWGVALDNRSLRFVMNRSAAGNFSAFLTPLSFSYVDPMTGPEARVSIGSTAIPQATLDVAGGVKIGNTNICNASAAGTLRYNAGQLQICNGTGWSNVTGSVSSGLKFGGIYAKVGVTLCKFPNPATGTCACPAGYTAGFFGNFLTTWGDTLLYLCYQ